MSKQPNRPRLGRGLNALLSLSEDISASSESTASTLTEASTHSQEPMSPTPWRMIDLNQIQPNPHQPRRTMNQESLTELANSLKANGLLQPVLVRPIENGVSTDCRGKTISCCATSGVYPDPCLGTRYRSLHPSSTGFDRKHSSRRFEPHRTGIGISGPDDQTRPDPGRAGDAVKRTTARPSPIIFVCWNWLNRSVIGFETGY
ncbi:MAG: hypothetical protein KatS3mg104_2566 [Phycisphaerae bacterium]|nr:MAG: hypothetical protein KatS3mg104_2566 [Phycisphaerae bacterium]